MIVIDRFGFYSGLECDVCGNSACKSFDSYGEVVEWMKNNGWTFKKEKNSWLDVCPDCREDEQKGGNNDY